MAGSYAFTFSEVLARSRIPTQIGSILGAGSLTYFLTLRQQVYPLKHQAMHSFWKMFGGLFLAAAVWSQTPRATLTLQQALETTLLHPQARIGEQQILASRGVQREASGIFDPLYSSGVRQSFAPTPLTTAQQVSDGSGSPKAAFTNLTTFNGGASQLYRSGVTRSEE